MYVYINIYLCIYIYRYIYIFMYHRRQGPDLLALAVADVRHLPESRPEAVGLPRKRRHRNPGDGYIQCKIV